MKITPDQIFGEFDAEMALLRRLARKQSLDAGNSKHSRAAGVQSLKTGQARHQ